MIVSDIAATFLSVVSLPLHVHVLESPQFQAPPAASSPQLAVSMSSGAHGRGRGRKGGTHGGGRKGGTRGGEGSWGSGAARGPIAAEVPIGARPQATAPRPQTLALAAAPHATSPRPERGGRGVKRARSRSVDDLHLPGGIRGCGRENAVVTLRHRLRERAAIVQSSPRESPLRLQGDIPVVAPVFEEDWDLVPKLNWSSLLVVLSSGPPHWLQDPDDERGEFLWVLCNYRRSSGSRIWKDGSTEHLHLGFAARLSFVRWIDILAEGHSSCGFF